MIRKLMAAICFLSLGAYVGADDDAAKKDLDALQGKWKVTSGEFNGQVPPADLVEKLSFTFEKDVMTIDGPMAAPEGAEKPEKPRLKFTIDPSTTPKSIRLEVLSGPKKGEMITAIYELEKDQLKLCMPDGKDDASPIEFKTEKGSHHALFVMEKAKE